MDDFCHQLNDYISVHKLSKASSLTSLIDDRSLDDTFITECEYCGSSPISVEFRTDIREVHRIIYAYQDQEHVLSLCTINSAAISVLPRPGNISRPETVSHSKHLPLMKSRLRYISFFGIGIDSRYLGIVCVLGPSSVCHVIRILPNASRVSNILQEHIILRYQKAVEARRIIDRNSDLNDKPMMSSIINMSSRPNENNIDKYLPSTVDRPVGRWKSILSLIKKT